MKNMDQVFLWMKKEIEKEALVEEQMILDEVKKLEESANKQLEEAARKEATHFYKQELDELNAKFASIKSTCRIDCTKKYVKERTALVDELFTKARNELLAFSHSDEYISYMKAKALKVSKSFTQDLVIYISEKDMALKDEFKSMFSQSVEIVKDDSIMIGGMIVEEVATNRLMDETLDYALRLEKQAFSEYSLIVKE